METITYLKSFKEFEPSIHLQVLRPVLSSRCIETHMINFLLGDPNFSGGLDEHKRS